MEEIRSSPSPPPTFTGTATTTTAAPAKRKQEMSPTARVKKDCLSFAVSLQEGFRHVKALFVGQTKKMTAKNEKEATAADLQTAKAQVEAADEAEHIKKELSITS